jgi:hypothetical protein
MTDEFFFNDEHDAKAEIRAAVRYLLKEASVSARGEMVRQITAIVSEEARGLGSDPLDEGLPGG